MENSFTTQKKGKTKKKIRLLKSIVSSASTQTRELANIKKDRLQDTYEAPVPRTNTRAF